MSSTWYTWFNGNAFTALGLTQGTEMAKKYLKSCKVKNHRYWWLVETHREGERVMHKKLKYWGKLPPGEDYRIIVMPLDDDCPLDDLCLVWKTGTATWHWQRRGDFEFWVRRGEEEWFWKSIYDFILNLEDKTEFWLTRAPNRSEAIKRVKEKRAYDLISWAVLKRIIWW